MSHASDPASVSGRDTPRPEKDVTHVIVRTTLPDGRRRVTCEPCNWAVTISAHYDDDDLARLEGMHDGSGT